MRRNNCVGFSDTAPNEGAPVGRGVIASGIVAGGDDVVDGIVASAYFRIGETGRLLAG